MGRKGKSTGRQNYLELRGSKWYFCWNVPKDARPAFGGRVIIKVALSSDKAEATRLAARLRSEALEKTHQYRTDPSAFDARPNADDQAAIERAAIRTIEFGEEDPTKLHNIVHDSINLRETCSTPEGAFEFIRNIEEEVDFYIQGAGNENCKYIEEFGRKLCLHAEKAATGGFDSIDDRRNYQLLYDALRKEVSYFTAWNDSESKIDFEAFRTEAKNREITIKETARHHVSRSLLNHWDSHLESKYTNIKTRSTIKRGFTKFLTYLSDNDLEITYRSVHEYLTQYSESISTRETQLSAISSFYKWAIRFDPYFDQRHRTIANPIEGHEISGVNGKKRKSYESYKAEEIKHLFDASLESGKNAKLLASLIAYGAYTGARLEELSGIDSSTTIWSNSEPIAFKVLDSKTKSGIRTVPLHPDLRPLHAYLLQQSGGAPIFPHRPRGNGSRIAYLSQAFGRLKTKLNFGELKTFHSFRHTASTNLTNKGVNLVTLQRIIGHKHDVLAYDVYLDEIELDLMIEAISTLNYDLDLRKIMNESAPH